ncbi:MAG: hypothetical protein ACKVJG_28175 [Candidatus Latescibacterota bacterium]|jgi:hypothetical protein
MAGQISNKVLRFLNLGRDQGSDPGGCGGGAEGGAGGCSSGGCSSGGCGSGSGNSVLDKKVGRRGALGMLLGGVSVVKA